jgi:hypothetical protein
MAIPPLGASFDEFYASVIAEFAPKQIVIVNPADYERIRSAMLERPEVWDRIELQSSIAVDPGVAISFPKPREA